MDTDEEFAALVSDLEDATEEAVFCMLKIAEAHKYGEFAVQAARAQLEVARERRNDARVRVFAYAAKFNSEF